MIFPNIGGEEVWPIVSQCSTLTTFWDRDHVIEESQRPAQQELEMTWLQTLAEGDAQHTKNVIQALKLLDAHLSELTDVSGFNRLAPGLRSRLPEFDATVEHVRLAVWMIRSSLLCEIEPPLGNGSGKSDCRAEFNGKEFYVESYRPLPRPANRINQLMSMGSAKDDFAFRMQSLTEKLTRQIPTASIGLLSIPTYRDLYAADWVGPILAAFPAHSNVLAAILWSKFDLQERRGAELLRPLEPEFPRPYLVVNPIAADTALLDNLRGWLAA